MRATAEHFALVSRSEERRYAADSYELVIEHAKCGPSGPDLSLQALSVTEW
jgi:hypothetical protein